MMFRCTAEAVGRQKRNGELLELGEATQSGLSQTKRKKLTDNGGDLLEVAPIHIILLLFLT